MKDLIWPKLDFSRTPALKAFGGNLWTWSWAAFMICLSAGFAQADEPRPEVVAVISSNLGPYQDALDGLAEGLGHPVPTVDLSLVEWSLSLHPTVVVAFGSKAALRNYPSETTVLYALAPGLELERAGSVKIGMTPNPGVVLSRLRQIQPGLGRLAVLWMNPAFNGMAGDMKKAGEAMGLSVTAQRLANNDGLPDALRLVKKSADAFWVAPDPAFLNADNLALLCQFSWSNGIPFYSPTPAFTGQCGLASVSCSFRGIGRAAATAAQQILKGGRQPDEIFPDEIFVNISRAAASKLGLNIPGAAFKQANEVLP